MGVVRRAVATIGRKGKRLERDPAAERRFRKQDLAGLVDAHAGNQPVRQLPTRPVPRPPRKVKPQTSSKRGGKTTCAKKRKQRGWGPVPARRTYTVDETGQPVVVGGLPLPTLEQTLDLSDPAEPTTSDLKDEELARRRP